MSSPASNQSPLREEGAVIRVFLVDDHEVVRQGLRTILQREPDIEVVGEASGSEEALETIKELAPDVVLMDIRMHGTDGFRATREIRQMQPNISVIMLTIYESELYATEAFRAGAAGYITKDCSKELLSNAIRVVVQGGAVWQGRPFHQLMRSPGSVPKEEVMGDKANGAVVEQLTARELEIVTLLAEGYENKQIAAKLGLADVTIKKHVKSIITKLGASNRTQAALIAVRLGLA